MTRYLQVATIIDNRQAAEKIASHLVDEHLAGCVQIFGPLTSVYRWEGKLETAQEWLCVAKTRDELYSDVEAAIRSQHTYQVPEILATPVAAGNAPYLQWLEGELKSTA